MAENSTATREDNGIPYFDLPVIIISIVGVVSNVLLLVAFIKDPLNSKMLQKYRNILSCNESFSFRLLDGCIFFACSYYTKE